MTSTTTGPDVVLRDVTLQVPVSVRTGEYDEDTDEEITAPTVIADRPLYHWAPVARRGQITRFGLRPGLRPSTSLGWRAPWVCFATTPSWAWALSGGMPWTPRGEWDLWQTSLSDLPGTPIVIPSDTRTSGIHEIRCTERLYKRDLWLVGSRLA